MSSLLVLILGYRLAAYIKRKLKSCRYYSYLLYKNFSRLRYYKAAYTRNDESLLTIYQNPHADLKDQCNYLVAYLAEAFRYYSITDYSHAYYPGSPSQHGKKIDAIEAVSRLLPLFVVYVNQSSVNHSIASKNIQLIDGSSLDIVDVLHKCFLSGTAPGSAHYWGEVADYDQRICESADLALTLWLSKPYLWCRLSEQQKKQVINWFSPICELETADNNWHLFTLTVQFVLTDLTGKNYINMGHFQRVQDFLAGDGWFRDGDQGAFDFYNAWGFYYSLYWLEQIKPEFSRGFIRLQLSKFTNNYRYFFTRAGIPLFGRSGCYRMAASAPLFAALDLGADKLTIGEAKRAFATSISYFIQQGAVINGVPTQGVFAADHRWLDNYSGSASSLWSLRALNIAYYCGERINLWDAEESPLMIERGDFDITIPAINAQLTGNHSTNEVVIEFHNVVYENHNVKLTENEISRLIKQQTYKERLLEKLLGVARRPSNNLLKQGIHNYSSKMNYYYL